MWMTIKIAWKNIWRNPIRSLVVIFSILFGVWSVISMMSLSLGMGDSYIKNIVKNQYSHLQVHHPAFKEDQETQYTVASRQALSGIKEITHYSGRLLVNGMLSTSYGARGTQIKGIEPMEESYVSGLKENMVEGDYLDPDDTRGILISQKLTEKFKLNLRSRVVLTFQDLNGDMISHAFRVKGIYNTGNALVDENQVFVTNSSIRHLLFPTFEDENLFHEIAIEVEDLSKLPLVQSEVQKIYPEQKVENYRELAPDLALMESQIRISGMVFIVIFMLALIFGILNTMLMAVLERYRELGMLQAIGMPKSKVFSMVVLETFFLSLIGVPLGYFLGYVTILYFQKEGLNLSAFSKGLQQFGMSERIYPILDSSLFIQLGVAVAITSLLASLYPSWKAISLNPVEAIRKI